MADSLNPIGTKFYFKIIIIGNWNTGKSSLVKHFTEGHFSNIDCITTLGIDIRFKTLEIEEDSCKLEIWDTAGQERYHSIPPTYYRKSRVVIIVYDITDCESFQNLDFWMSKAEDYAEDGALMYLVGNKCDKTRKRVVGRRAGEEFAGRNNMEFVEVSAKSLENVENLFEGIAAKLREEELKKRSLVLLNTSLNSINIKLDNTSNPRSTRCCLFRKIKGS